MFWDNDHRGYTIPEKQPDLLKVVSTEHDSTCHHYVACVSTPVLDALL